MGHLFGTHTTRVGVKAGVFLRDYVYTFLEMLAPPLTRAVVTEAVQGTPNRWSADGRTLRIRRGPVRCRAFCLRGRRGRGARLSASAGP